MTDIKRFNPEKVKRDIEKMLEDDFFPKSSKSLFYGKIVPRYNAFFRKFSGYALYRTSQAMGQIMGREKFYVIHNKQFFPRLYEVLQEHLSNYLTNVELRQRKAMIEKEDVDSVFNEFSGK